MKKIKIAVLSLTLIALYNCKESKKTTDKDSGEIEKIKESISFSMEPKNNSNVKGEVSFFEKEGQVNMVATFSGLSVGEHAIHLHKKADCSSEDGKSTGGHWNPTNEPHGKWGAADGYHKGDIGNFVADSNGDASVEFSTSDWCIGCDDVNKNILDKAVIVHQGTDDFTSQPSGDAGSRISCTAIIQ